MTEPGSGTKADWKERARLVLALARWDAVATLSSRWLWMARHFIPGLLVSALAVFILFEALTSKQEIDVHEPAKVLGRSLIHAAFGFAAIGMPSLVYMRFREARRTGMLEALILSPMSRSSVLIHQVLGRLWAGAYCLLAAAPALALASILGAYAEGELALAIIAIAAAACCAAGFAILVAVRGASFDGFVGQYALSMVFAPAALGPRIWMIPCAFLYMWLGAYSPFLSQDNTTAREVAFGLGMPLQSLAWGLAGRGSVVMFAWAVCGAMLWSAATLALALRRFSSQSFAPAPAAVRRPTASAPPVGHQDLVHKAERGLWKRLYHLSGRNPLVWLLYLRHGEGALERAASSVCAVLGILAMSPFFLLGAGQESIEFLSEGFLVIHALLVCHRTTSLLGKGTSSVPSEILSSPLGGSEVVRGAAVACLGLWLWPFVAVVIRSLAHGLITFSCYAIWAFGTLLFALAVAVWMSPVRGTAREKMAAAFIIFFGIYWLVSLATRVRLDSVHCLLVGGFLQALALALLAVFPFFFRSLTRASVSISGTA